MKYIYLLRSIKNNTQLNIEYIYLSQTQGRSEEGIGGGGGELELTYSENRVGHSENYGNTAICVQAQTANIFARLFTFETGHLPLETEMFHRSCDVSH